MSNLPEIPTEKYVERYKAKVTQLQDELFKIECLAESLLNERNDSVNLANQLQARLDELEKTSDDEPIEGKVV